MRCAKMLCKRKDSTQGGVPARKGQFRKPWGTKGPLLRPWHSGVAPPYFTPPRQRLVGNLKWCSPLQTTQTECNHIIYDKWGPSVSFLDNSNGAQITRCYFKSQGSARKANHEEEPQRQSLPGPAGLTSMNSVHVYFTSGLSPRERGCDRLS